MEHMQSFSRQVSCGVVAVMLAVLPAAAQSTPPRYNVAWHGSVAGAALLGSTLIVLKERNEVPSCRWCGVDAQGAPDVPGVDEWAHRRLRWTNVDRATNLSHATAGAAFAWPLIGLTTIHRGVGGDWGRDQLVAVESVLVAQVLADTAKRTFRRARPHVVFNGDPLENLDDVHSYFSGHTATSFAAVISTATIASRRGSRHARWIWVGGLTLASSTGYLRVAANRHFLTDVLTGAAVGSAVGLLVPRAFDGPSTATAITSMALPISGVGPAKSLGPRGAGRVTLQVGAGSRSLGVLGSLAIP